MIVTLRITLICGLYFEHEWSANIELEESSTLEDLHFAIQDAVEFDNDHLYCFFLSRMARSRGREYFDEDNGLIFSTTLRDLFPLPDKKSLFYLFDWGDDWIFRISASRKRPREPVEGLTIPESRVNRESNRFSIPHTMRTTTDSWHRAAARIAPRL